jgi:hypothetical protein
MSTDKNVLNMEFGAAQKAIQEKIYKLEFVKQLVEKLDANRKSITYISTGLGIASAFLPWKTLGPFSLNALQITNGWLFVLPFIASAVYIGLNWPSFKTTKLWVGTIACCAFLTLLNSYSDFDVELPDTNLNMQKHNATGIGYWLTLGCYVGLLVSSFESPIKDDAK